MFLKLDSRYADYFSEYSSYYGRDFIVLKSMYGMTNSGKLFADELIDWFIDESGFKNSNTRCLYITSMHHMELKLLFYLMLMVVSIGINMKILENG